ncbi:MAG: protein-export membrane protein SecF [Parcubacteria group bacterium CG1_02_39_15]|uniref:Protein-export membrane protein SecF n=4 Tax=Candidatus Nealsoniibacteriota TaxID=1817911 RepID=A0A2G9YUC4_9BACT|nr:MAG: protein-export membrane protein SecF [Parcubacteria group bacterium CG1_02_39_15]PIP22333.1 MAG: protein translocase subunit SecF [Candidatus Nealsonbacteria bacterium CG23_combo_of_CG06-09_8_20_14_all_39_25]PIQ98345.1 MAG: protein translocase subunit SecF [Candidatus Nealsonbacteria bacterium CG11_big_fil_rev_8_21_14_0_20_39_9]PIW90494.1 MAG: protein translocase subunit SecF [Candidatus Nealsonbacteria bacterium CG_4_8_14_3_um_filter_40_11]PIZ88297.1 MAG: protein translocase subunit Se
MSINFLKYSKIYFIFSAIVVAASIASLIIFGLKPGIDFTGGSILEIDYKTERPSNQTVKDALSEFNLGDFFVQPADEKGVILRMGSINEEAHQKIIEKLKETGDFEEARFESIGPTIGRELREKTKVVIALALLVIVLYIAIAFRKVSRPVTSWQYGIASLFSLFHDILIPLGIFSLLGKFYQIQITIPVICALLAVIGYAINNVVVVYDRIRENLLRGHRLTFEETVNASLNQTLTRQLNTSLTTLFPLLAIFFLGGETLRYFALTLILGIAAGTYSSIFLASPLLVSWLKWRQKSSA